MSCPTPGRKYPPRHGSGDPKVGGRGQISPSPTISPLIGLLGDTGWPLVDDSDTTDRGRDLGPARLEAEETGLVGPGA